MRNRFSSASVTLAAILLFSCSAAAQEGRGPGQRGQGGQGRGSRPPTVEELQRAGGQRPIPCVNEWKLPNGCDPARVRPAQLDPHDLTGVWTRAKGMGNMGSDVDATMTPEGRARFGENKPSFGPRAIEPARGNDPMGKCDPLGLTRNIFLEVGGRSFEFLMGKDRIVQFFEWAHQYRTIWTDGRALPKDPEPRWNGYSVGHWDGDTLVVDTLGWEPRSWSDMWGHPHSDEAKIQERYKRISPDQIEYSFTLADPKIYTKPFVTDTKILQLNLEKSEDEKLEQFCVPSEEEAFNKNIRDPAAGINVPKR